MEQFDLDADICDGTYPGQVPQKKGPIQCQGTSMNPIQMPEPSTTLRTNTFSRLYLSI